MALALVSAEFASVVAMVALLVGIPVFVIGVIAITTAYFQYDAERYLESLETEEGEPPVDDGQ